MRLAAAAAACAVTWGTRLVALLAIASALLPAERRKFNGELRTSLGLPTEVGVAGIVTTLVAGVALWLLAAGLGRWKRRAWALAVGLALVLSAANLLHAAASGHGLVAGLTSAALLGALVGCRHRFVARPEPGGLGLGLVVMAQLALAGFGLVWALLAAQARRLVDHPSAAAQAAHAALSLIGVSGPVDFTVEWLDDLTASIGLAFGVAAVAAAGYFLLRSPEPTPRLTPDDETAVRGLLARHGHRDSLGYFALRRDKTAVLSPSGKSAVSYRVLAGVALASGDPLGDVEAWPGAIEAYLTQCATHGWVPAALGCSERGATAWARAGLDALELGDEAVVDTDSFSMEGRPMRGVRQAVARVRRAGYVVHVRRISALDSTERADLETLASAWRLDPVERGYSMALSRVANAADPDGVIVTAELDGSVRGLLQFVPWGADGLSLDLMRRDPAAENGLNELMITELIAAGPSLGLRSVSLNFALFRAALERGERIGAGPVTRMWSRLLRMGSRWWQIDSLYRFNAKFRPRWVPRFVVFPTVRDLPRIMFAALEAEGFGGRPPAVLRLLRR
jgi:lysyl-tRNA synthetase class 2